MNWVVFDDKVRCFQDAQPWLSRQQVASTLLASFDEISEKAWKMTEGLRGTHERKAKAAVIEKQLRARRKKAPATVKWTTWKPDSLVEVAKLSKEAFIKAPPAGFKYDASLHEEANKNDPTGRITLGPKFFELPVNTRNIVLIHEIGHDLSDITLRDGSAFELADAGAFGKKNERGELMRGINGKYTPGENMAEAYAVLWEDPSWLRKVFPMAYHGIIKAAKTNGFPLPKGVTDGS